MQSFVSLVLLATLFLSQFQVKVAWNYHFDGIKQGWGYLVLPNDSEIPLYGKAVSIPAKTLKAATLKWYIESGLGYANLGRKYPRPTVRFSMRTSVAKIPDRYILFVGLTRHENKRRRIMLFNAPASTVWHLPLGIAQLASLLKNDGHEVEQRYGHILGLEHVLRAHDSAGKIEASLVAVHDPAQAKDIMAWYRARMTFDKISRDIPTSDKLLVERNNVRYLSEYYNPVNYNDDIVGVCDAVAHRDTSIWYDYFLSEVRIAQDFAPHIYGISINDERQIVPGIVFASIIHDALPGTVVVIGGNVWARFIKPDTYHLYDKILDWCDTIVYGEGFVPIREIAETLDPALCSGTVWRDRVSGELRINTQSQILQPFEELPTPVFARTRQWTPEPMLPLYTMSNCPKQCSFCGISAGSATYLKKPRAMSPARIAEHMVTLGAQYYDLQDELVGIDRNIAIGDELRRIGYNAQWQCFTTITNDLLDPVKCERLSNAGCRIVQLGLESLSPNTLRHERKAWNSPENYGQILKNLRDAGIQTHIFILIGLPGEPASDGLRWLPFLEDNATNILTIKAGRNRIIRSSPEEQSGLGNAHIQLLQDKHILHLNRDFQYLPGVGGRSVRKDVEALRHMLEQACHDHWAYDITSTLPYGVNRIRFTWEELEEMASLVPHDYPVERLPKALKRMEGAMRSELGKEVQFTSLVDVNNFLRTI